MDYDQQISKINNEIIEVKTKIKKANEKRTNAIISRNNQLWKEVIKDEDVHKDTTNKDKHKDFKRH